jgi:hypothetical protein
MQLLTLKSQKNKAIINIHFNARIKCSILLNIHSYPRYRIFDIDGLILIDFDIYNEY